MPSPQGRKNELGISVSFPVSPQEIQCGFGQGNKAIFTPLSSMNVDHHSLAIDVRDLQIQRLLKPESTGVDRGQIDIVVEGFDLGKDSVNFFPGQVTRQ